MKEGKFYIADGNMSTLVYSLKHYGWFKGKEQLCNDEEIVVRGPNHPERAKQIRDFLNSEKQNGK